VTARAEDWPQWLGLKRDGVWRETGIVEKFPPGGPKVRWRVPIGGGYAGPAVAAGRVYVTDRQLGQGVKNPENPFARPRLPGSERVLCLNESDGAVVWKYEYPCEYDISYQVGPRTTPLVADGKVYTLGAMGDLVCLRADSGALVWSKSFPKEYGLKSPMWGWSASPLLDGDRLICLVGGDGTTGVAFHKDTGKELWRALSASEPGYCPPTMIEAAGKRQVIIWHPEAINALNPETGEVYWSLPFPDPGKKVGAGMTITPPVQVGDYLFLSTFYSGPILLKLNAEKPGATVVWQGTSRNENKTDKLHTVMAYPVIRDGHIYGVDSYGELRCLKLETGERLWETYAPTSGKRERWGTAFLIPQGDRFFLFSEKGDLIIARLSPRGYEEIDRAHLLEPTSPAMSRDVVWSVPAFANRCCYARNDRELICVSLAKD
jgi:outer membrane protein assembly factor BamB